MKLKPLFDRVILEPVVEETKTNSGIVLPSSSQERPNTAIVIAVGKGNLDGKKTEMEVSIGNKVVYSNYAGTTYKIGDKNYIIVRQTDILAIIE